MINLVNSFRFKHVCLMNRHGRIVHSFRTNIGYDIEIATFLSGLAKALKDRVK